MRIHIRHLPPTDVLEGFELRRYALRVGEIHDLPIVVAEVLIGCGYAEAEMHLDRLRQRE